MDEREELLGSSGVGIAGVSMPGGEVLVEGETKAMAMVLVQRLGEESACY